jgi:multiple sugar transport system permease protein
MPGNHLKILEEDIDMVDLPELAEAGSFRTAPRTSLNKLSAINGLIFVSPWLIGFVLFKLVPIITALGFSFTNFYMMTPDKTQFIGLQNYLNIFIDQEAGASLFGSIGSVLFVVPIEMAASIFLAVLFNSERLVGKRILRTLFFLPSIIPAVAIFVVVEGLSNPNYGWISLLILKPLNLPAAGLDSVFPFVMALWSIGPGFMIMLSALESVSREVYEAARVDGAGPIMRLFSITLPIISPAIFFSLVINLTNAFGGVVLLDRGLSMSNSMSPMEAYIGSVMFNGSRLGYASALAWMMLLVEIVIVIAIFKSAHYWVYFPEEGTNENN